MEEIKLWRIVNEGCGKPVAEPVPVIAATSTEQLLEETLTKSPELLIPGLHLVGRQTETDGGPLDLLGVDDDGRLVVFELKRGNLTREAVAQLTMPHSWMGWSLMTWPITSAKTQARAGRSRSRISRSGTRVCSSARWRKSAILGSCSWA